MKPIRATFCILTAGILALAAASTASAQTANTNANQQTASTNQQIASANQQTANANQQTASANQQTASANQQTASTNKQTAGANQKPDPRIDPTSIFQRLLYPELAAPESNVDCSVFLEKHGRVRPQQGMEIKGKYLFSLEDGGHVNIYNFKTADSDPIGGFELASSRKDNHANNAEFGIETKKGASFPLMYISNGKVNSEIEWLCYVESITHKKGQWSTEIAQTIHLDGTGWEAKGYTAIFGAPSWLIDRKRHELWVFSAVKRTVAAVTKDPSENKYVATKFRIPKLSEGKDVYLTADDILDQAVFPFDVWFTQAGCCVDGKIYYGYGVGDQDPNRPSRIRVYDTDKREISARYELQGMVHYEIEDIVVKGKWMYVNTNTNPKKGQGDPLVYRISLPKRK